MVNIWYTNLGGVDAGEVELDQLLDAASQPNVQMVKIWRTNLGGVDAGEVELEQRRRRGALVSARAQPHLRRCMRMLRRYSKPVSHLRTYSSSLVH